MREYGVGGSLSDYQEDHLISLELGGHPTDPRNLWPEPYPRASEVDSIENDLNTKVCAGELTLDERTAKESDAQAHGRIGASAGGFRGLRAPPPRERRRRARCDRTHALRTLSWRRHSRSPGLTAFLLCTRCCPT